MSLRPVCKTVYFYQPDTRRDEPVTHTLTELAERYPCYGFKKLFQRLRRQGNTWNHKRIHRIYCLLKLNFRRKGKRRLPIRNPAQRDIRILDRIEVSRGDPLKEGRLTGTSTRAKTRDGKNSNRKFNYCGSISGYQITLIFENIQSIAFDTGANVFTLYNDRKTMVGISTSHGKAENKIITEPRVLRKATA